MATLSDREKLIKHRGISTGALGGIDWKEIFEKPDNHLADINLDDLVTEHIEMFWSRYFFFFDISLPKKKNEHKLEHLSIKTVYFGKG